MNDKEVRNMLENEQIPKELEPENIKLMLDQKAPAVKRKKISAVSRFAAVAAACAVVSGTAVHFASKGDLMKKGSSSKTDSVTASTASDPEAPGTEEVTEKMSQAPYMSGAKDYSEVYELFKEQADKQKQQYIRNTRNTRYTMTEEDEAAADGASGNVPKTSGNDAFTVPLGGKGGGDNYSTTFNQEENVLEGDIVKTDGKKIYSVHNYGKKAVLHITDADDGALSNLVNINISADVDSLIGDTCINKLTSVDQMYVYDDMVLVVGTTSGQLKSSYNKEYRYYIDHKAVTFVAAYSLDDSHKNIGIYCQDGGYSDVRISPDGYMYLISTHTSFNYVNVKNEDDVQAYIPQSGFISDMECIPAENIYMPRIETGPSRNLCYSVIGSIDLNESEKMTPVETKALAGYAETWGFGTQIYCAPDNLYSVSAKYFNTMPEEDVEYGHTEERKDVSYITRFAISAGRITPSASGEVEGLVNDQFSMSEYDEYFRIATTRHSSTFVYTKGEYYEYDESYAIDDETESETLADTTEAAVTDTGEEITVKFTEEAEKKKSEPRRVEYGYYEFVPEKNKHDNALYVLDLDLNEVGYIDNFGKDEDVQSVAFAGDKAYVTTFRQRDPLFAIDLSTPASPTILSEFKMNGYSSYMQQWTDGQLLGFGPDADDEGGTTGVKMTMFDNSDPNELKAIDVYAENWETIDDTYRSSSAVWDRKALLIDPKKNIIAYPVDENIYNSEYNTVRCCYNFFRFEDGKFRKIGTLYNDHNKYDKEDYMYTSTERAIYIGDYVYIINGNGITSADIDTISKKDSVTFEEVYDNPWEDAVYTAE